MITPVRVQLSRAKGWRMPSNTVKVDRSTKWGNPARIGELGCTTADSAVMAYRNWLTAGPKSLLSFRSPPKITEVIKDLRGKNLACWCAILDKHGEYIPCHADVLLAIANGMTCEEVRDENIRRATR